MTATESSTRAALWQRFVNKADAIGAGVQFTDTEMAAADAILRAAAAPVCTATLADRFPILAWRSNPGALFGRAG